MFTLPECCTEYSIHHVPTHILTMNNSEQIHPIGLDDITHSFESIHILVFQYLHILLHFVTIALTRPAAEN